jgi:hypothetical protein
VSPQPGQSFLAAAEKGKRFGRYRNGWPEESIKQQAGPTRLSALPTVKLYSVVNYFFQG